MNKTEEVSFSICLPTYNRAKFLPKCIQSIIRQTYKNFELVITDNCSTDNTFEIINSFCDNRINYYVNDVNLGLWENHNEAIRKARNAWIVFIHSDEELHPMALELMVKVIKSNKHNNIGVILPLNDRPAMSEFTSQPFFQNKISSEYAFLASLLGIGNPSGMCFSSSALYSVDGFNLDNEIYYAADHFLLAEIANKGFSFFCAPMSFVFAEEGDHQSSYNATQKRSYESIMTFYNRCSKMNLFDNSIKIFLNKSNSWSKFTHRKFFFRLSTIKNKKYAYQILFSKNFMPRIMFSRESIYALGNIILGYGFYNFLLRLRSNHKG